MSLEDIKIIRKVKVNDKEYECDDYRPIVDQFAPEILKLINPQSKEDRLIQERFLSRLLTVHQVIDITGNFTTTSKEITFFDILFDAIENNISAQELLKFINNCIKEIILAIPHDLKNKIKNIIYDMIVNFNEKESCFYSRVAELACLKEVLKNGKLKIIDIENKLLNGKSVDMVISYNNGDCFIDVLSMRITEGKIQSGDDMYKILLHRIANKYEDKFQGLSNQHLKDCGIMPVLWGDLIEFKQYKNALEKLSSDYKNQVIHPHGLVYCPQKEYKFTSIKNITDKIRKNRVQNDTIF